MKMKVIFIALTIFFSNRSFSQIIFEKGYFIDNTNQKIECLIKNIDWKYNPTEFEYMLPQESNVLNASIKDVKEFAIYGISKYIRTHVKLDRSSDDVRHMSYVQSPIFKQEQLFLKVMVEGKASLFYYEENNLVRFFYNVDDSEIEQLIYKRYRKEDKIFSNNDFRLQLYKNLLCQTIRMSDFEKIKYTKGDLEKIFEKFNECSESGFINHEKQLKRDLFNLSVRPGFNYSKLKIQNSIDEIGEIEFNPNYSFRFGIEAEYIFPFNKNKWGLVVEPTYQFFQSEISYKTGYLPDSTYLPEGILVSKINYKSIEVPFSARHYIFINEKSKVFINISYLIDIPIKSTVEFTNNIGSPIGSLDVKSKGNMAFGIGYKCKGKYSLEMRYHTDRDILKQYIYWNSDYNSISLIFGYTFF